jgi:hypothetical protein
MFSLFYKLKSPPPGRRTVGFVLMKSLWHFMHLCTVYREPCFSYGECKRGLSLFPSATAVSRSRGSSVSIVSDYGLDDRAIGVRSLTGAKDFSSILCVQAGFGAHPASCTMGTEDPFPGGKAQPERNADHSPHLVPRSRMSSSYISSPPKRLHDV